MQEEMKAKLKEQVKAMKVEILNCFYSIACVFLRSNNSRLENHLRCKRRNFCWGILYNFTLNLLLN